MLILIIRQAPLPSINDALQWGLSYIPEAQRVRCGSLATLGGVQKATRQKVTMTHFFHESFVLIVL